MNKQDMVKAIAADTAITQVQIVKVINSLEKTVKESLAKGEKVQLTGFVTIKPIYRAARKGFDPLNKVPMAIPATIGVSAKAGEKLKQAVKELDLADFAPVEPVVEETKTEA